MAKKVSLKSLNPHITCGICKGYLIDATTVTECLHTFCKSCLVMHLEEQNTCPKENCGIVIHQSHPLNYISYDRTMQDIVYKLVPNLQQNEIKREKEFYRSRGLPYPKANASNVNNNEKDSYKYQDNGNCEENSDYHRSDEQVNIVLESQNGCNLKQMKRKYIRCSSQATVTHLKKFVTKKLFNNFDKYKDIDILCNDELLGIDHTLKFAWVTKWRHKSPPLRLCYRPRVEF